MSSAFLSTQLFHWLTIFGYTSIWFKVESGKKRPPESSKKTPVPEKKVKMATPQKTG